MNKKIDNFQGPDFKDEKYMAMEDIEYEESQKDGTVPEDFYLTSHFPTYYKYQGQWILPEDNSLNCVAVLEDSKIIIKELRNVSAGDKVVKEKENTGIVEFRQGFSKDLFTSSNKSAETSFSADYERLFSLMKDHRQNDGYITWILGPAVVFDYDTRKALVNLAKAGYVDCLLGGNAMCTHDLEAGYLDTALGQNIYTQENAPQGHYNHLDLLNDVREAGSMKNFIDQGHIKDGFIKTLIEDDIPIVLAGSIRDDGPLPETIGDQNIAMDETKEYLNKSSLVICIATMLHSISAASMTSSYRLADDGSIQPIYFCGVDITENILNKIGAARDYFAYIPIATNVQDFVVNCERSLLEEEF